MLLLDTNVCIEFLRNRLSYTYQALRASDPRIFGIPAVVAGELYVGVEKSKAPERGRRAIDSFLAPFEIVPFDGRCARTYAHIRAHLEREGTRIGGNDLLIAATALVNGATLVTRNEREFMRVPGLSVEVWDEVAL